MNVLKSYLQEIAQPGISPDFAAVQCRYGTITIYCIIGPEKNIIHLTFAPEKHKLAWKQLTGLDDSITFKLLKQEHFPYNTVFIEYFTGNLSRLPVKINSPFIEAGTPFQKAVWQQISAIPYGNCITYQKLAEQVGSPKGVRAVGTACGANPLALIIPCQEA
jgi:O6-methylguanine-DNA--protein-cysteine methyltransferase